MNDSSTDHQKGWNMGKLEKIKKAINPDLACYVLITCSKPNEDGKMDVETAEKERIHVGREDEIYKFALGNRPYFFNSIIKGYYRLAEDGKITREEAARFEKVFNQNVREYYNALGNKYLNKPITRIRYTFLILEEADDSVRAAGLA